MAGDYVVATVQLYNLTKRFRNKHRDVCAVDGLTLDVVDGEFLVLVGPSGCGKTTTLRLIAGLDELTEGQVLIGDADMARVSPKDRDVAMVFQSYALYPHMTAYKNMAFGLKMRRVPKAEIDRQVRDTAKLLGIVHLLEHRPAQLSGGEQQRVALGRAIVRKPNVFLLDEPFANLDAKLRLQMRAEIKRLHRQLGTTLIHVTHDQEEAMTLGDRMAIMNQGRLEQCGTPMEIYEKPANRFVAEFIGTPTMNFIAGTIESSAAGHAFVCPFGRLLLGPTIAKCDALENDKPVRLGIRPQHLQLVSSTGGHASDASDHPDRPGHLQTLANHWTVEFVERLGDATNVHLSTASDVKLVMRLPSLVDLKQGESVRVGVDMSKAHLFEAQDQENRLIPIPV